MEDYNWISAKLKTTGETVRVRQESSGDVVFCTDNGVRHNIYELDFTQTPELPDFMKSFEESNNRFAEQQVEHQELMNKMLSSMDANAIADHKAKIAEREYWRKLRGDIFFALEKRDYTSLGELCSDVKTAFEAIYNQDKDFFKGK